MVRKIIRYSDLKSSNPHQIYGVEDSLELDALMAQNWWIAKMFLYAILNRAFAPSELTAAGKRIVEVAEINHHQQAGSEVDGAVKEFIFIRVFFGQLPTQDVTYFIPRSSFFKESNDIEDVLLRSDKHVSAAIVQRMFTLFKVELPKCFETILAAATQEPRRIWTPESVDDGLFRIKVERLEERR